MTASMRLMRDGRPTARLSAHGGMPNAKTLFRLHLGQAVGKEAYFGIPIASPDTIMSAAAFAGLRNQTAPSMG